MRDRIWSSVNSFSSTIVQATYHIYNFVDNRFIGPNKFQRTLDVFDGATRWTDITLPINYFRPQFANSRRAIRNFAVNAFDEFAPIGLFESSRYILNEYIVTPGDNLQMAELYIAYLFYFAYSARYGLSMLDLIAVTGNTKKDNAVLDARNHPNVDYQNKCRDEDFDVFVANLKRLAYYGGDRAFVESLNFIPFLRYLAVILGPYLEGRLITELHYEDMCITHGDPKILNNNGFTAGSAVAYFAWQKVLYDYLKIPKNFLIDSILLEFITVSSILTNRVLPGDYPGMDPFYYVHEGVNALLNRFARKLISTFNLQEIKFDFQLLTAFPEKPSFQKLTYILIKENNQWNIYYYEPGNANPIAYTDSQHIPSLVDKLKALQGKTNDQISAAELHGIKEEIKKYYKDTWGRLEKAFLEGMQHPVAKLLKDFFIDKRFRSVEGFVRVPAIYYFLQEKRDTIQGVLDSVKNKRADWKTKLFYKIPSSLVPNSLQSLKKIVKILFMAKTIEMVGFVQKILDAHRSYQDELGIVVKLKTPPLIFKEISEHADLKPGTKPEPKKLSDIEFQPTDKVTLFEDYAEEVKTVKQDSSKGTQVHTDYNAWRQQNLFTQNMQIQGKKVTHFITPSAVLEDVIAEFDMIIPTQKA